MSRLAPHGLKPLWLSAWFALGFVGIRVLYRVAFGGANGDGSVLAELPRLRLPAPFTTVSVGGTITTDGIVDAAISALPFAAIILLFGVIGTIVDVRTLLLRVRPAGPGRAILTAAGIALATFPVLVAAVTRVRQAGRWRGLRPGIWILSPVLSWTVEHAVTVAGALESRGFGRTASPPTGVCEFPIEARNLRLSIGDRAIVQIDAWSCPPGSVTLVAGDTGSGKTTLLRAIVGLFQHLDGGEQSGMLRVGGVDRRAVAPRETAHFVAYVPQNPRSAFIAPSVREELRAGIDLCVGNRDAAEYRAATITRELGLDHLAARPTEHLSAGEATLVAIAVALVSQPTVLVLDEPLADLDLEARARVLAVLTRIARTTEIALVIAEHRTASLAHVATHVVDLEGGHAWVGAPTAVADFADSNDTAAAHAVVTDLAPHDRIVAVCGPNGAGKSTLLRTVAASAGSALVPERPADILFADSVAADCRRNDRARRLPAGTTLAHLQNIAPNVATSLAHPHDLSAGEQLELAVSLQTAHAPAILLVDEPTRGLDPASRQRIAAVLQQCATTTHVIIATHDLEFSARLNARVVHLEAPGTVSLEDLWCTEVPT